MLVGNTSHSTSFSLSVVDSFGGEANYVKKIYYWGTWVSAQVVISGSSSPTLGFTLSAESAGDFLCLPLLPQCTLSLK